MNMNPGALKYLVLDSPRVFENKGDVEGEENGSHQHLSVLTVVASLASA
jgi:hypothetical protein